MDIWKLFSPKSPLNQEDEDWQLVTWLWFLKNFGGLKRLKASPVVAPTDEFFPPIDKKGDKLAGYIFDRVKTHARMSELSCKLIAQPQGNPQDDGELVSGRPISKFVSGTFSEDNGRVVITYDPAKIQEPLALVSIFAHELAHYSLSKMGKEPPGGTEMAECVTDLMTVFLGFGVFGADCAFNFRGGPGGGRSGGPWTWSRLGYLREVDWVFALRCFSICGENPFRGLRNG